MNGSANGILVNIGVGNTNADVTIKDVTVRNFLGDGISVWNNGATLTNVQSDTNGDDGFGWFSERGWSAQPGNSYQRNWDTQRGWGPQPGSQRGSSPQPGNSGWRDDRYLRREQGW